MGMPDLRSCAAARLRTVAFVVALAPLAAACGSAAAAPVPPAAPPMQPHPAMAILARMESAAQAGVGMPDLTGLDAEAARVRLRGLGVDAHVVAFDESTVVTAQYPEPGATPDGPAILWVGVPPAPPEPEPEPEAEPDPAPETARPAEGAQVAEVTLPSAGPAPASAGAPRPPSAAAGSPGSGISPGDPTPEGFVPPPRTSPRVLAALPPGTVLEGRASWYGPGFEGRTTACGGVFDPRQLTLASRELRCGTRVRVTGPSGASVEAVATDWGPAEWTDRRFDLSQATFAAVHNPGAGVVHVTVEVLG
jgi:hypothetical protein